LARAPHSPSANENEQSDERNEHLFSPSTSTTPETLFSSAARLRGSKAELLGQQQRERAEDRLPIIMAPPPDEVALSIEETNK
jgi:hypothetical protein